MSNTTDGQNNSLCYKNGLELPLLDFNTTCSKHGRFVIFYNERLEETKYPQEYEINSVFTELCEVTVTGIVFQTIELSKRTVILDYFRT